MNNTLIRVMKILFHQRCIGGKHTPEKPFIKPKIMWVTAKERKEFKKEYSKMIKKGIILKEKKKTKKGQDWHISLNPHRLDEIHEWIR